MKLDALYLTPPHGRMAAEGEKRMVVKSRKYDVAGKTYWLASGKQILGTIELDAPKAIGLAEFKRRHARHLISEDERKEWWPQARTLYAHRVTRIHRLRNPRPFDLPQGAQTFVKDIDLDVSGRDFIGGLPKALDNADPGQVLDFAGKAGMTFDLMYLVEPFAGMVYNGEKTVLLKAKPFQVEGKRYWLGSTRVYGIVKWGNQRKINLDQFKDLRLKHRATEAQRRRWWPDKAELWAYDLISMRRLKKPIEWWDKRRRGNRVFIGDITLPVTGRDFFPDGTKPKSGVLANITAAELKDISDRDLLAKRLRMHQLWSTTGGRVRGLTRDGFIEKHALVVKEMKRRGLERRTLSDLDRATNRVLKAEGLKWIRAACEGAGDIVLAPAFVSLVGSFADGRIPTDLDALFHGTEALGRHLEGIETAVAAELAGDFGDRLPAGGMHPIWQPRGPQGRSVPLYDLVLRKRERLELRPAPDRAPLSIHEIAPNAGLYVDNRASFNGAYAIQRAPAGERFLVEIDFDDASFHNRKNEAIPEALREALDTIRTPSQCTLELAWDGRRAQALDMVTRYGGDLSGLPLRERLAFLHAADLGQIEVPAFSAAEENHRRPDRQVNETCRRIGGPVLIRDLADSYHDPRPWWIQEHGPAQEDRPDTYLAEIQPAAEFQTRKESTDSEMGTGSMIVRQPKGRTFPFVVQVHYRGIPPETTNAEIERRIQTKAGPAMSAHTDLRAETPEGNLIGWTLFTPPNSQGENKLLNNGGRRIQVVPKKRNPREWLRVAGRIKAGSDGATREKDAYFTIEARGRMTYGTQKDGFFEYFLKFAEPKHKALDGRWIITRAPVRADKAKGATATQGEREVWLMSRPADQRPYIDAHPDADGKDGNPKAIYQYEPVPGLDIPRKGQEKGQEGHA